MASSWMFAALIAAAVQTPITSVTVYSDRARVVRTGVAHLQGQEQIEFPLLDQSVDASTIQLEAQGGTVQKIDIAHVDEQDFPRGEARELLSAIEKVDDQIAELEAADNVRRQELAIINRVSPGVKLDDNFKPLPKLNGAGWAAAIKFIAGRQDALQAELQDSREKLFDLHREREKLAVDAAQIGGARRQSGHRVRATVQGDGPVKLTLTYRVGGARWTPSYDVQFLPDRGEAQVSFSGMVSQESGEDWTNAMLTLSTAVPASSTSFPKLLTWKIGERERFIPTPSPQPPQPIPPAPGAPPPLPRHSEKEQDDELRARLAQIAQAPQAPAGLAAATEDESGVEGGVVGGVVGGSVGGIGRAVDQPMAPPRYRKGRAHKKEAARPAEPMPMMEAPKMAMAPPAPPPPSPMSMMKAEAVKVEAAPMAQVGLAPPPAYMPPTYDSTLPASLAGGYDLAFDSARKETIKSGEGARRVPLFSEAWPVKAERVLYPALAPEAAFLVAEIKNAGERVLPGGPASLAVGLDPAGTAQLKLVSAGETFTLPLGLDRALKPIRNVNLVTEEKGVFSKDEVTHYVVTIEIANPYKKQIPIRIVDQVPLPANKDAELNVEKIEPAPSKRDKDTGRLEWALTMAPSSKQIVSFTYSLKRPKGYRLYQEQ